MPRHLFLAENDVAGLEATLDPFAPINLLLYGPPGTGKTSTARMFLEARGELGGLTVDASIYGGVESTRRLIDGFASTMSFSDGIKICFIDEAECLSQAAQSALRGIIERNWKTCRFILATNDCSKINKALRSRLHGIDYGLRPDPETLERVQQNLSERMRTLGLSFDRDRLNRIVATHFPDLRRVNNELDFAFGGHRAFQMER
jgi:DNA polymerase III delta prime subunit